MTEAEPSKPLEDLLPEFEKAAEILQRDARVPGMAIGVVHRGEVVYLKGFGVRKTGTDLAVNPDTVFQIASCSKPVTATALASLVGKGVIGFDQPVAPLIPEFQLYDPWVSSQVSFADLLSHRSGLPTLAGDHLENLGLDRTEILKRLRYLKPAYPFRTSYAYTNFGFTAAGEAAARANGTDFASLLEQELFQPLGMSASSTRMSDYIAASNRAFNHQVEGDRVFVTAREPDAQAPAGGVSSSARDLTRFMLLHLQKGKWEGRQLIPSEALAETYKVHSVSGSSASSTSSHGYYGIGWRLAYDQQGQLKVQHSGAFVLGVRSSITLLPEEDLGIVVLSNAFPSGLPEGVSELFLKAYKTGEVDIDHGRMVQSKVGNAIAAMSDTPASPKAPEASQPSLALPSYTGTFGTDYYGKSLVTLQDNRLVLSLGKKSFPLTHIYRDTFVAQVEPHRFEDLVSFQVQFSFDNEGKVSGFHQSGLPGPEWFSKRP